MDCATVCVIEQASMTQTDVLTGTQLAVLRLASGVEEDEEEGGWISARPSTLKAAHALYTKSELVDLI